MTRARPSRRRVAATSLVALIAATGVASPAAADSGQALVEIGRFSNGTSTGIDPASLLSGLTDNQGAGGNFGVSAGPRFTTNAFTYVPPADTSIAASSARVTDLYAYGWPAMSTWTEVITSWGSWNVDGNPGEVAMSGVVSGGAASTISAGVRQASHGAGTEQAGRLYLDRLAITLTDLHPPRIDASPGAGTLFGVPNSSGWYTAATLPVTVSASDRGLGVRRLVLRDSHGNVHATALTALPPTCVTRDPDPTLFGGDTYTASVPCPTAVRQYVVPIDMTRLGDGQHDLQLGIQDASGRIAYEPTTYPVRVNAPGDNAGPGGTAGLPDPGTPCTNGSYDDAGTCIVRPPSNSGVPRLSGVPAMGRTLTTDSGTWDDVAGASYTYDWLLCDAAGAGCTPISGEHGTSLALVAGMVDHTIRAVVTAATAGGTTRSTSAASYAVVGATSGGSGGAGAITDVTTRQAQGGGGSGGRIRLADEEAADLPVPGVVVHVTGPNGRFPDHPSASDVRLTAQRDGTPTAISGRLTTADRVPIAGAQIDVIVHDAVRGAKGRIAGAVTTSDDGTFTYSPTAGNSRIYTFGYRLRLSDTSYAQWTSVAVPVAAAVALTASRDRLRNGEVLTLSGRVANAPIGSRRPVDIQALVGHHWETIGTTQMRSGTFAYRYRFTRTTTTRRYTFRALVSSSSDWPLSAGASRRVMVTVRGATTPTGPGRLEEKTR